MGHLGHEPPLNGPVPFRRLQREVTEVNSTRDLMLLTPGSGMYEAALEEASDGQELPHKLLDSLVDPSSDSTVA